MADDPNNNCDDLSDDNSEQADNRPAIPTPDLVPANAALTTNVAGPAMVTIDGQTVQQQDLRSQIAADRYLNSKAAIKQPGRGFLSGLLSRIIPPGSM